MRNLVLFFIAYLLFLPISILNYLYVVYVKDSTSKGYFRSTAVNLDRFGNREFRSLFNAVLIKQEGYQFGNILETISSVLGKNERDNTLTKTGKRLVWLLNCLDKDHCKDAIHEFEVTDNIAESPFF